jgi:hypothetical protein
VKSECAQILLQRREKRQESQNAYKSYCKEKNGKKVGMRTNPTAKNKPGYTQKTQKTSFDTSSCTLLPTLFELYSQPKISRLTNVFPFQMSHRSHDVFFLKNISKTQKYTNSFM